MTFNINSQFEFLEYEKASNPDDKHIGVATVRCWGKIVLKYKIMAKKDGKGFYAAPGGFKAGYDPVEGKDRYESYFTIDSVYENKKLEEMIYSNIAPYLNVQKSEVLEEAPF